MKKIGCAAALLLLIAAGNVFGANVDAYYQTNLVSDLPGVAAKQDPGLVNPWGLAASGGSPIWVADNNAGVSTVYSGSGSKLLQVTVPANPTGIVVNTTSTNFGGSHFIFDTESGVIASWTSGASAVPSATGAMGSIYKGLAINQTNGLLYAANFGLNRIDVFNSSFAATTVPGNFVDPTLPAAYAPFNVQNIGGQLYVTYALSSGTGDETTGSGFGYVDIFDLNGNFVKRVASQGALNAPWGLAIAPSGFGAFGGDLLVGNFGNGEINAYNLSTDTFAGTLDYANGNPVVIDGLWGLLFGNGSQGQGTDTLYFAAGIPGPNGNVEDNGLYGSLDPVPEPGVLPLSAFGLAVVLFAVFRRSLSHS
ncbi:MAG: TIGR03118 family protein [Acidobacteriaceae bacterium]|nr:TIGR03118 family protein [Acidobacteriaceae bacterium]